jgi:hypothetical protein
MRVRGRFLPEHTIAVSLLDRLLPDDTTDATTVVTSGESHRMREARTTEESTRRRADQRKGWDF